MVHQNVLPCVRYNKVFSYLVLTVLLLSAQEGDKQWKMLSSSLPGSTKGRELRCTFREIALCPRPGPLVPLLLHCTPNTTHMHTYTHTKKFIMLQPQLRINSNNLHWFNRQCTTSRTLTGQSKWRKLALWPLQLNVANHQLYTTNWTYNVLLLLLTDKDLIRFKDIKRVRPSFIKLFFFFMFMYTHKLYVFILCNRSIFSAKILLFY